MRITVDVSPAVNGKAGLGRYAHSLALALHRTRAQNVVHLFANVIPGGQWPDDLADLPRTSVRAGYKGWRLAVLMNSFFNADSSRMLPRPDVFHATEHLLIPLRDTPSVLTVHDLIFKLYPEHHKKLNYYYLNLAMPLFVRRATHLIAVSQTTKDDVVREYGVSPDKITVVYEAAAPRFQPQSADQIAAVRAAYHLPDRYLLHVGTIEPRKNLARLVEALAVLRADDPDLRLVVVGSEGWLTESFHAAIARTGQSDAVMRPGFIPDADLPAVYAGALAAVVPSLYEGFGLPVLEAMACGTPVACSATSSLGEVAGEAALTFEPTDLDALIEALRRLLADADLRADLRARGLARAAEFSWDRAARETWAVYRRLVNGS